MPRPRYDAQGNLIEEAERESPRAARPRYDAQGNEVTAAPLRAPAADVGERTAQERAARRREERLQQQRAIPFGLGGAVAPFRNIGRTPSRRDEAFRTFGEGVRGLASAGLQLSDLGLEGIEPTARIAPNAAQRAESAGQSVRDIGRGVARLPRTASRAIGEVPQTAQNVARATPGVISGALRAVDSFGLQPGDLGLTGYPGRQPSRTPTPLTVSPPDERGPRGPLNWIANTGGQLLRDYTVGPFLDEDANQSAYELEEERQRLGLPASAPLRELASQANANAGHAALNIAFAPADAALLAKGGAQALRAIPRGAPRPPQRPSSPAGEPPPSPAARRALRMIDRRLQQAERTIDDVAATSGRLSRQGGGIQETIAEIGGKPLQNAARAVANVEGPGQQIAETFLAERAERVGQRVMSEVTRAAQPQQTRAPRDYWDASDALQTARSGQAREGYRALYGYGKGPTAQAYETAVQERLLPYLRQAPPEAAASGARQLATEAGGVRAELARAQQRGAAADEIGALQSELDDMVLSQRQLEGLATGQAPNSVTTRAVDYFQRGLSQMERTAGMGSPEARALGNTRRAFNGMADDLIPPFNDVRTRYAAAERIQEFMDQGRRVFSMAEGEINLMLRGQSGRGLSMEEFDGFMLGVMDALQTKIRAGDTRFVSQFMRNENWQAQLERAFTPPPDRARRALEALRRRSARGGAPRPIAQQEVAAQQQRMARAATKRLYSRIEREAHMQDFNNAMRAGSRTTPMAQDIKGLTTGEDSFGFIGEIIEGGGNVKVWGIRQLARAWDKLRRPGIYDPEVNRELATRLFQPATTGNVAKLREELAALRRRGVRLPAGVEGALTRVANRMAAVGTVGAVGMGAVAAGDAQAQEGSPELVQVRRDLQALRSDLEVIRTAARTEASDDVKAAQRILRREGLYNGRIDGIWLGQTTDANRQFQPQLAEDIAELEQSEAYLSTRPTEEQLSARHNLPTYALLGGAVAGHLAHFPGQGFNRLANRFRARSMNRAATTGSSEQRAASMNAIHARGGAPAGQLPFNVSETGQFTPNRNVAPETSLFQPRSPVAPYLSEGDLLLGTAALGEVGITGQFVLPAKERELREAREALTEARTQENYQRVEDLENEVAQMRALRNAGIGMLGGQIARGAGSAILREPTYLRPRPDWARIQTERAALNRQFRGEAQAARQAQTHARARTQAVRAEAQARRAEAQAARAEAQERLASARAAQAQAQAARAEAQAEKARLTARERAARERRRRRRAPPSES